MLKSGRFDLSGRSAIVTGGAGIIGSKVCAGLAEQGAAVAIVDINEQAASELAKSLNNQYGPKVIGVSCDVSDPGSVDAMAQSVSETLGTVDILFNNAATKGDDLVDFFKPYEDYSLETWRQIMDVNVDGMFLVSQAIGKRMKAAKVPGSIIQTSSIYGIMAPDQRIYEGSEYMGAKINTPAVYAASKAAVVGLSNYLATYWGDFGIRVNTLVPGGISSGQNTIFSQAYSNRVPMGRMASSDDMVGTVVFLASDAASYITGQTIAVDGGLSVW